MDRIQAKEKINKLLRLANDKGATESERDTALEMANKLASKFSFKIQRGTPSQHSQEVHNPANCTWKPSPFCYSFDLNCFNKKFVEFLFKTKGIKDWTYSGKKTISFDDYRQFDVEAFKKFYKKFVSVYYKMKKHYQASEKDFWIIFVYYFCEGMNGEFLSNCYFRSSFNLGIEYAVTKFFN